MTPEIDQKRERTFFLVVCALGVMIRVWLARTPLDPDVVLEHTGPDDLMHIMSVRDWISGQGWYDMKQYRILPPEGLPLHWSRYVMLGPAVLLYLFDIFLPPESAQLLLAIVWPTILLVAMILIVGIGTARAFGGYAGAFAILMLLTTPGAGLGHFAIGQMDHHNSQAVLMALAVVALIWVGAPRRSGFIAAFAVALSLAIGLETLFLAAGIGLASVVSAAFGGQQERERLRWFCLSLVPLVVLLHMGQTAPADWLTPACDRLASPVVAMAIVGAASGLAGLMLTKRPSLFLVTVALTAVIGLLVIRPLIGTCLEGPYANLPPELQDFIFHRISEARPLLSYLFDRPINVVSVLGPSLGVMGLAIFSSRNMLGNIRIVVLLLLSMIAICACLWQIRQMMLLAPIVSPLAGFSMAVLYRRLIAETNRFNIMAMVIGVVVTMLNWAVIDAAFHAAAWIYNKPLMAGWVPESQTAQCEKPSALSELNKTPQGIAFVPLDMGPSVAYWSHHDTLAAGYHRSKRAFYNGALALDLDEADFGQLLRDEKADYLILCKGTKYENAESIGTKIAQGYVPSFLEPVPEPYERFVVLRVVK